MATTKTTTPSKTSKAVSSPLSNNVQSVFRNDVRYGSAIIPPEDLFQEYTLKHDEKTFHGSREFSTLYKSFCPAANARFMRLPGTHTVWACLLPGVPSLLMHSMNQKQPADSHRSGYNSVMNGTRLVEKFSHEGDAKWFKEMWEHQYGQFYPFPCSSFSSDSSSFQHPIAMSTWVRCPNSITRSIKRFFADFDADKAIDAMQNSKYWPKEPYRVYSVDTGEYIRGFTRDEIKAAWDRTKVDSGLRGTYAHLQFEKYFEREWMMKLKNKSSSSSSHPQQDVLSHQGSTKEEEEEKIECDTSIPEWEPFNYFLDHFVHKNGWQPRIPEMLVADDYYVNIFGFIDMVFYDPSEDAYVLVDYKRCKQIKERSNDGNPNFPAQYGYPPLDDVEDCNYNHYTLQLNLARKIVEQTYGWRVSKMYIVNVHPNISVRDTPRKIVLSVPRWDRTTTRIIHFLRNELLHHVQKVSSRLNLPCPYMPVDQTSDSTKRISACSQPNENAVDQGKAHGDKSGNESGKRKSSTGTPTTTTDLSLPPVKKQKRVTTVTQSQATSPMKESKMSHSHQELPQRPTAPTYTPQSSPTKTTKTTTATTATARTNNEGSFVYRPDAYHPQFPTQKH